MDVVLPPGIYLFQCESFAGAMLTSRDRAGHRPPGQRAHPYQQVTSDQIQAATLTYRHRASPPGLGVSGADTDALGRPSTTGKLATARQLWLPAHLDYARLGAAYDTFGNFNNEINGRPLGLVGGVERPATSGASCASSTGCGTASPTHELVPVAGASTAPSHGLIKQFPQMLMPANDLSLRTHEILENTLQFELTGETDEGSNTNLATAWANVQGTQTGAGGHRRPAPGGRTGPAGTLGRARAKCGLLSRLLTRPGRQLGAADSLSPHPSVNTSTVSSSGCSSSSRVVPDLLELPVAATGDAILSARAQRATVAGLVPRSRQARTAVARRGAGSQGPDSSQISRRRLLHWAPDRDGGRRQRHSGRAFPCCRLDRLRH